MMRSCFVVLMCCLLPAVAWAVEHRVEPLAAPPPADSVSPEIAALLAPSGVKVIRGAARTVCEIWLCKEWGAAEGKPPSGVNYPFAPGQLMGVIRFPKKGSDFRDQDIAEGVYTLRYGQQPVDGAHVGTSATRDFLLLLNAEKDKSPAVIEYKPLTKQSAEAAGSNHPALLSLQKAEGDAAPAIRHDEGRDWWIVHLQSKAKIGGAAKDVALDFVVVGHASE